MSTTESQASGPTPETLVIVRRIIGRLEDDTWGPVGELIGYEVGHRRNRRSIVRIAGESEEAFYDRVVEAEKPHLVGNNVLVLMEIRE